MRAQTTVAYPPRAAPALGHLKRYRNDIAIFVEDESAPNMWVKLIRRFLPSNVKFSSVTPLQGRESVIAACRADQTSKNWKRLYIIDADFDIIQGKSKPNLLNLYRLRRYCVENYLLQYHAIIDALTTFNADISEIDAETRVDLASWIEQNDYMLKALFVAYSVVEELNLGVETVGYSPFRLLIDKESYNFSSRKVCRRVFSLYKDAILRCGKPRVRMLFEKHRQAALTRSCIEIVSAKDYIFPLLHEMCGKRCAVSPKRKTFLTAVAERIDPAVDRYFERRLTAIANG